MGAVAAFPRLARVALVVGILAAAAGGAWLLGQAGRDDGHQRTLRPFYLEAVVTLVNPPGASESDPTESMIRWWYRAGGEWRLEFEVTAPAAAGGRSAMWAHDGRFISYEGRTNTFHENAFRAAPHVQPLPLAVTSFLGPVPGAASIDDVLDYVRRMGEYGRTVDVVGEDRVAGRDVIVIASRPVRPGGSVDEDPESAGELLMLVDAETNFVLAASGSNFRAETRVIRYNTRIDDADLRFQLPADARRVE